MKEYIAENFKKNFIEFSKAFYFTSILFTLKINKDLWFCINYWEFNIIMKCNCYFILLIDKVLMQILDCKYITHMNIITTFNKLWMYLNNENLTIFITFFSTFKYKILPFSLTNESVFYQQYINKVLFNFLNCFVQIYFDDILIYNKTYRKHVNHIHLILKRL